MKIISRRLLTKSLKKRGKEKGVDLKIELKPSEQYAKVVGCYGFVYLGDERVVIRTGRKWDGTPGISYSGRAVTHQNLEVKDKQELQERINEMVDRLVAYVPEPLEFEV